MFSIRFCSVSGFMAQRLTPRSLSEQNHRFAGTRGISQNNRCGGFLPAFCDLATGKVYLSVLSDGRQAPIHLLNYLPAEIVVTRDPVTGQALAVKDSVVDGFVRDDCFYTRDQVCRILSDPSTIG